MDRLPPLSAIRAFEAAGRHENFSRAADELGLTQAAVSYQIRQLEDRIGRPLFVREKGRVRLSDSGRRLLPAVTSGFAGIAEAFAALRDEDGDVLNLDTAVSFGGTWLSARIGRFQLRYPDLAVRMTTSNEVVDLRSGDADVGIRAGPGGWEGMDEHKLFNSTFTPMVSPDCLAEAEGRLGRSLRPADIPNQNLLSPGDDWWQQWFADNGVVAEEQALRRPGVRLDNQANEGHAAMAGLGFALLTPLLWKGDVAAGRLVVPFPDSVSARGWAYWLVYPKERRMIPKVKRFREWLLAEMEAALASESRENEAPSPAA